REKIDRGLASTAFEAQMKAGGDAIERKDKSVAGVVSLGRRMLEQFRGREVLAPIEGVDRFVEFGTHANCPASYESSVSLSSTTRNSVSVSGFDLREPYFSYISKIADLCGRTLLSGHFMYSSSDSSQ